MNRKEHTEDRKRKKKRLLREHVYVSIKNEIIGGELDRADGLSRRSSQKI